MVDSGIILIKYWLEVSADEQTRRLESRIDDPRKIWKLSDMDLKSYGRWFDYSRARDDMFAATDTAWAPWFVAHTDDKKRGRLNIISHLLGQVPYEPLPKTDVTLPKRQKPGGYQDPNLPLTTHPDTVLTEQPGQRSPMGTPPPAATPRPGIRSPTTTGRSRRRRTIIREEESTMTEETGRGATRRPMAGVGKPGPTRLATQDPGPAWRSHEHQPNPTVAGDTDDRSQQVLHLSADGPDVVMAEG